MDIRSTQFITSAVKPNQYPSSDLPEIAFAGRSNVGKSSLINSLVNRKNLVRTSSTPGRTQLINFFNVNQDFTLVDLPGFGYAQVPLAVKKQWGPMVETYLAKRKNLRAVLLLVDIRRTPGEEERQLLGWLDRYGIKAILIATKCDKVSKNERVRQRNVIARALQIPERDLTFFSTLTKEGRDEVWGRIEAVLTGEGTAVLDASPSNPGPPARGET